MQTCRYLIRCAERLEAAGLEQAKVSYLPPPRAPQRLSKRHAEKLIYAVTIFTWLTVPLYFLSAEKLATLAGRGYLFAAGVIAGLTIWSLAADIEVAEPT